MSKWLLRGLVFAALMVILRLLQGAMINEWETKAGLISAVLIAAYGVMALVWATSTAVPMRAPTPIPTGAPIWL